MTARVLYEELSIAYELLRSEDKKIYGACFWLFSDDGFPLLVLGILILFSGLMVGVDHKN